jgi:hypothetical protein
LENTTTNDGDSCEREIVRIGDEVENIRLCAEPACWMCGVAIAVWESEGLETELIVRVSSSKTLDTPGNGWRECSQWNGCLFHVMRDEEACYRWHVLNPASEFTKQRMEAVLGPQEPVADSCSAEAAGPELEQDLKSPLTGVLHFSIVLPKPKVVGNVIELHPSFAWDCAECGVQNFARSIARALPAGISGLDQALTEYKAAGYAWTQSIPKAVTCFKCGANFLAQVDLPGGTAASDTSAGE